MYLLYFVYCTHHLFHPPVFSLRTARAVRFAAKFQYCLIKDAPNTRPNSHVHFERKRWREREKERERACCATNCRVHSNTHIHNHTHTQTHTHTPDIRVFSQRQAPGGHAPHDALQEGLKPVLLAATVLTFPGTIKYIYWQ